MKNNINMKRIVLLAFFFFLIISLSQAQPLPSENGGGSGTYVGGNAPLDINFCMLIFLSIFYTSGKWLKDKYKSFNLFGVSKR